MPYISVKLSTPTTLESTNALKEKLGKAISLIPGKSEAHLMVEIESDCTLFFHGESGKMAFVEVKLLGKSTKSAYTSLTAEICTILNELYAIDGSNIYVAFQELENWGYNSFMF